MSIIEAGLQPREHVFSAGSAVQWLAVDDPTPSKRFDPNKLNTLAIPSIQPIECQPVLNENGNIVSLPLQGTDHDGLVDILKIMDSDASCKAALLFVAGGVINQLPAAISRRVGVVMRDQRSINLDEDYLKYLGTGLMTVGSNWPDLFSTPELPNVPYKSPKGGITIRDKRTVVGPLEGMEANVVLAGHVAGELMLGLDKEGIDFNKLFGTRKKEAGTGIEMRLVIAISKLLQNTDEDNSRCIINNEDLIRLLENDGFVSFQAADRRRFIDVVYNSVLRLQDAGLLDYTGAAEQGFIPFEKIKRHAAIINKYEEIRQSDNDVALIVFKDEKSTKYKKICDYLDNKFEQGETSVPLSDVIAGYDEYDRGLIYRFLVRKQRSHGAIELDGNMIKINKRIVSGVKGVDFVNGEVVDSEGNPTVDSMISVELSKKDNWEPAEIKTLIEGMVDDHNKTVTGEDRITTSTIALIRRYCEAKFKVNPPGSFVVNTQQQTKIRRVVELWNKATTQYVEMTRPGSARDQFIEEYKGLDATGRRKELIISLAGKVLEEKLID